MKLPLYQQFAGALDARTNVLTRCFGSELNDHERSVVEHWDAILDALGEELPSGSGFDGDSSLVWHESTPDRLVFTTSFHHMTEGTYDGWTQHAVVLRPSLVHGIEIQVTGRNRDDIFDHVAEVFESALREEVEQPNIPIEGARK